MTRTLILRSLLFVPADSAAKLAKSKQVPADALVLDLEDAVTDDQKPAARSLAKSFLGERNVLAQAILVRCNAAGGSYFDQDCEALKECLPDGIVLSKCRTAEDVLKLQSFLDRVNPEGGCRIYPLIESPLGLLNAYAIASSSPRVAGLTFGAEDYSSEAGIHRTAEEIELLYARSALVTASRAAGCEAIDSPWLEPTNIQGVRSAALQARNLGFSGKLAIHPAQVPPLNETFSPSASEIEEARTIIAAYSASGKGVFAMAGRMVDEAIVQKARRTLSLAEAIRGNSQELAQRRRSAEENR
jgi:citrate lyase subunit beta/citryl-CoA lyase